MPLGVEIGLGPGHIVIDGDPSARSPTPKGDRPNFGPCLLWPNRWMDQDTTWYEGRPRPRRYCVSPLDGVMAPPKRGHRLAHAVFAHVTVKASEIKNSAVVDKLRNATITSFRTDKNSSGDEMANVNFLLRQLQPLLRSAPRKLPNSAK